MFGEVGWQLKKFFMALLALVFFAANSVLCRMALTDEAIDPATFTSIRLVAGALVLYVILLFFPVAEGGGAAVANHQSGRRNIFQSPVESWLAAAMLFLYASSFSFAYMYLDTALGALILFTFVQLTMLTYGHYREGGITGLEIIGVLISISGLGYLVSPGIQSPDPRGIVLMAVSGIAWGGYSILGKKTSDSQVSSSSINFRLSLAFVLPMFLLCLPAMKMTMEGIFLAIVSGALASAVGYVIWYWVVKQFKAAQSGVMQLLVPIFAAVAGYMLMDEMISQRLMIAASVILLGILATFLGKRQVKESLE
ncbi:EamA family transporter [Veronia nyctiphanis]|uniref:EamA family transporter n=1 Tax=Veronia nyctiphanis TaxID=1278244 RepID=A0A4Q0YSU3_9GAMM|nr:DMT family transporter [Veronia nyctiphanis]RXJ74246.1 EamA family transporter [Veronia nyctiphanis]